MGVVQTSEPVLERRVLQTGQPGFQLAQALDGFPRSVGQRRPLLQREQNALLRLRLDCSGSDSAAALAVRATAPRCDSATRQPLYYPRAKRSHVRNGDAQRAPQALSVDSLQV